MSNYSLEQLAHQTIDERVAHATRPKAPHSTVRVPEQRHRKALARGLRRVADVLDN